MAKFYAVKNGREPGVYTTWPECEAQVKGYPGAIYKSFKTDQEAAAFIAAKDDVETTVASTDVKPKVHKSSDANHLDVYVDGSYNATTNKYGCGIYMSNGSGFKAAILANGECKDAGRNVEGEVFATVHAVNEAFARGFTSMTIHHDYQGIGSWADKDWATNKNYTKNYADFIDDKRNKENCNIDFVHVKGHTGDVGNEIVDKLAKLACGADVRPGEITELQSKLNGVNIYNHTSENITPYFNDVKNEASLESNVSDFHNESSEFVQLTFDDIVF